MALLFTTEQPGIIGIEPDPQKGETAQSIGSLLNELNGIECTTINLPGSNRNFPNGMVWVDVNKLHDATVEPFANQQDIELDVLINVIDYARLGVELRVVNKMQLPIAFSIRLHGKLAPDLREVANAVTTGQQNGEQPVRVEQLPQGEALVVYFHASDQQLKTLSDVTGIHLETLQSFAQRARRQAAVLGN